MKELRTFEILIKDTKMKKELLDYIYKYRHFENILLILIKQNYALFKEGKEVNDFKYLCNYSLLRGALLNYKSKNNQDKIDYIKGKYKDNQLFMDLTELAKGLKIHNLSLLIKKVKSNYKTFFTTIKTNPEARPPKPKKLSKLANY